MFLQSQYKVWKLYITGKHICAFRFFGWGLELKKWDDSGGAATTDGAVKASEEVRAVERLWTDEAVEF